ncbi:MAG: PAS domain S-box protein, partial [Desulfobacterales bacterium]|nr:PAS domain S-box protein [Desulfobacterales bacterium]
SELYKPLVSPSSRIEEIAHLVLEKARDLTGSLHGYVSSIDPRNGDNVCHTLTEMLTDRCKISEKQRKIVFSRGEDGVYPSLWGYSLNTQQAFLTNSPEDHQASKGLPDGHIPVTRFLSVPVLLGNEVVGQIALANKDMDYHERDLEAIRRLAGHYALAIQRIRTQEEIRKSRDQLEIRVRERTAELAKAIHELRGEIEERMRVERALKESERKYSTLVEESLTGVYIEQDGKIEFANERFAEVYGYSREEIIGQENWKLVFPEDRDLVREIRQKRLSGQEAPSEYEARGLTREGKTIWVVRRNKVIQYRQRPAILGNVVDITGRKEMEVALLRSEKELRLLSSQLLSAEEKERKRIARELHDGIGQLLSAIKFGLENTLNQMEGRVEKSASESFQDLIFLIQKATEEVRRIVMDLRPSTLDDLGILPTINWFCREFQTIYSGIAVEKEIAIQERDVPEEVKTAIYRVLQEAFNNIAKHGRTDWVGLSLTKKEGRLDLAIRDHGVGFHTGDRSRGGFGLASMRERTELSGGIFSIESAEGKGTLVHASWPAEEGRDESGRE